MSYSCSRCSFTAQFESALMMHHQLHHEQSTDWEFKSSLNQEKSKTIPSAACERPYQKLNESKGRLGRTSSATRLFEKLRARLSRSKTLFVHPEEDNPLNDLSGHSECTSKAPQGYGSSIRAAAPPNKEIYSCHLCSFNADRITNLDRHLLNDHKIGLEHLLKLVMSKTKDRLSEESAANIYGEIQPYYKQTDEIIEDGEFVLETVAPKIKILKHTASNTDLKWTDIPDTVTGNESDNDKSLILSKLEILNECMCKFADSSNTLKKVLKQKFDQKSVMNKSDFALGLGDSVDSPRDWEKAHSEKLERHDTKHLENRSEKTLKHSSESFYF